MKPLAVLTVLVAALVVSGAPGGGDDAEKEELKKLEGTWRALQFIQGGKPETAEKLKKIEVVFTDNKLTVKSAVRTEKATVKLDPSKTPAEIDIQPSDEKKTVRGIYKLAKNQLTICYTTTDGKPERPKEFKATPKDATTSLLVLERVAK